MWHALGELPGVFGVLLARFYAAFGVDLEPGLASILPHADVAPGQVGSTEERGPGEEDG